MISGKILIILLARSMTKEGYELQLVRPCQGKIDVGLLPLLEEDNLFAHATWSTEKQTKIILCVMNPWLWQLHCMAILASLQYTRVNNVYTCPVESVLLGSHQQFVGRFISH